MGVTEEKFGRCTVTHFCGIWIGWIEKCAFKKSLKAANKRKLIQFIRSVLKQKTYTSSKISNRIYATQSIQLNPYRAFHLQLL
jgi:hypothetical protein